MVMRKTALLIWCANIYYFK